MAALNEITPMQLMRQIGTPFDVEDTFWGHRCDPCTFDTMLAGFKLETEQLMPPATVVRTADINQQNLAPESVGRLVLSVGLSKQYKDDLTRLDAGLNLYNALYRWDRDGVGETHDWPANQGASK